VVNMPMPRLSSLKASHFGLTISNI